MVCFNSAEGWTRDRSSFAKAAVVAAAYFCQVLFLCECEGGSPSQTTWDPNAAPGLDFSWDVLNQLSSAGVEAGHAATKKKERKKIKMV
jgi:hypothetical protein